MISFGLGFGCARRLDGGTAECWGANDLGALGRGPPDLQPHIAPLPVSGLGANATLFAKAGHACTLLDGQLFCWGLNATGELANGLSGPLCGAFGVLRCKPDAKRASNLGGQR